jgi:hypothetical protein
MPVTAAKHRRPGAEHAFRRFRTLKSEKVLLGHPPDRLQSAHMYPNIRAGSREMGFRFHRSVRLMPGVRVNLGLRGASLSVGRRGMTYNIGPKGSRVTLGIPGTGISYTQAVSHQNPVTLVANSLPQRRQYSATPFVIIAFFLGLIYLATHTTNSPAPSVVERTTAPHESDVVGSIELGLAGQKVGTVDPTIPLPRPRPKLPSDPIGPPLQIVPK